MKTFTRLKMTGQMKSTYFKSCSARSILQERIWQPTIFLPWEIPIQAITYKDIEGIPVSILKYRLESKAQFESKSQSNPT